MYLPHLSSNNKFLQSFILFFFYNCILNLKAVFLSMTTNERMNFYKYKHFQDKNGDYRNPFKYELF